MVGLVAYYLISNTLTNVEKQSIATGFGFLQKEAAFEIGESPLRYSAADTYGRALVVGFLNTLIISFVGIIITVILGTLIGIARLSSNWLVSKLAAAYIEVFQDIPVLLQLFFWYAFFYNVLPSPRQALNPIMGVFLSNRGLVFAVPEAHPFINTWPSQWFSPVSSSISCAGGQERDRRGRANPFRSFVYPWHW
jgi:general L-amino acid transport system permease protein